MGAVTRFYSRAEVAERTGLSEYQVEAERKRGRLPFHEVGARPLIKFTDDDIAEFERRTRAAQSPAALVTTRRKRRRSA